MLSPNTLLQNRYRIKRAIAKGGMGMVYEAEATHLDNTTVAVKQTFLTKTGCANSSSAKPPCWRSCAIPRCPKSQTISSKASGNFW